MAGAWSCPHEADDVCTRGDDRPCQPGMKGCVLFRRFVIFDGDSQYPGVACAPREKTEVLTIATEPQEKQT